MYKAITLLLFVFWNISIYGQCTQILSLDHFFGNGYEKWVLPGSISVTCNLQGTNESWNVDINEVYNEPDPELYPEYGISVASVNGNFTAKKAGSYYFTITYDYYNFYTGANLKSDPPRAEDVTIPTIVNSHLAPTCSNQFNTAKSNSRLVSNSSGSQLYYISTTGNVCALWKSGSTWYDAQLNAAGIKAIGGKGLHFLNSNTMSIPGVSNSEAILYTGTNNKIYKKHYYAGVWKTALISNNQFNNASPNSQIVTNSSGTQIYYINTSGIVCALWKSGSTWYDAQLNASGVRAIIGSALAIDLTTGYIYYTGTDNKIYKVYYSSGWKSEKVSSNQWNNVHSNSEIALNATGSQLYYVNSDGYVCALWKSGSTWYDSKLSDALKAQTNSPLIVINNEVVFYSNGNKYSTDSEIHVYSLYYNNGWLHKLITRPGLCREEPMAGFSHTSTKDFYIGTDGKVYDYSSTTSTKSASLTLSELSDITKEIEHKIAVFPNPSSGIFTINLGKLEGHKRLLIYNLAGTIVYTVDTQSTELEFNLSDQPTGLYMLNVTNGKETFNHKFVIE